MIYNAGDTLLCVVRYIGGSLSECPEFTCVTYPPYKQLRAVL